MSLRVIFHTTPPADTPRGGRAEWDCDLAGKLNNRPTLCTRPCFKDGDRA